MQLLPPELREITPQMNHLTLTSRWYTTPQGSLLSAWAGAYIKFVFSGSALRIRFASQTERKDRWNGGIQTLEISVVPLVTESAKHSASTQIHRLDPYPQLVFPVPPLGERCIVGITHYSDRLDIYRRDQVVPDRRGAAHLHKFVSLIS
ncbi:hypothetical protein D9756_000754 [Leucocoprinus leucothites]|uniref:Uncharacterized protein n=1 Tax=Leucocoprinus leucothites TaxID=201217 RepID=A0A8H5GFV8_9AGAR|nr:hypothetical protein D9756_000754 [Leucoagaricus leucothites]